MRAVFADTCYWIALLNPKDQTHDIAIRASKRLTAYRIVTTEEVLTEFLNYFGARGPYFRTAAAKLVERMQADRSIQILPQTQAGFLAGLQPGFFHGERLSGAQGRRGDIACYRPNGNDYIGGPAGEGPRPDLSELQP